MAAAIRWRVPYRLVVKAADLGSSKIITNTFWYRAIGTAGPAPAYGTTLVGSDILTFINNFITSYATIRALLNANYSTIEYIASALVGKRYSTPAVPIAGMASSLDLIIDTGFPHGLTTGNMVYVYGVTTPSGANGQWIVTVTSPTQFHLNGSAPGGIWSGDGFVQLAGGRMELLYSDATTVVASAVGGVAGDALPLFAAASVRRLNSGTGRNFRSRLSFSPMSESDSIDGGWTAGRRTAWATALGTFFSTDVLNGATDAGQAIMYDSVMSGTIALGKIAPFAESDSFCRSVTSFALQRNSGSIVRRKPRLTVPIA